MKNHIDNVNNQYIAVDEIAVYTNMFISKYWSKIGTGITIKRKLNKTPKNTLIATISNEKPIAYNLLKGSALKYWINLFWMMHYLKYQKAIHYLWIMLKFISPIYWRITFVDKIIIYCSICPILRSSIGLNFFKTSLSHISKVITLIMLVTFERLSIDIFINTQKWHSMTFIITHIKCS